MNLRLNSRIFSAAAAACALFGAAPACAVINPAMNYQGYLISKVSNLPVETPQDIKFLIFDTPTGVTSPLFSETHCNVPVTKGRYDVEIGSATTGGIPADIFSGGASLWLEVQVDGDNDCAGSFEAMTPRIKLQASPYAFSSVYATTASVATADFYANNIRALPFTDNGAITISTNLFVLGGISVGSISPGQTLAVAGIVESSTGGFKFPDGSIQTRAAAFTMWDIVGANIYTINPGNVAIGENNTAPQARLHISSAAGASGDILLVSTGASQLFRVNGSGEVHGGSFYGNGTTLSGIVRSAGDTMTGPLTVSSTEGVTASRLELDPGVYLSSASAAEGGGVRFSSHVYLPPGAVYYGDGSGLTDLVAYDSSKVAKAGDTMTGQLTLSGSSLTVTGGGFSVGGSTLSVSGGYTSLGTAAQLARLTVGGGIIATSSITSQGTVYASSFSAAAGQGEFYSVRSATATFWGHDGSFNTITSYGGIKVEIGTVDAPFFKGNGSQLTNVSGTDSTRLLKAGDTATGNFVVAGASLTVASYGNTHKYALTVASSPALDSYSLAVTTSGYVGIRVADPGAQLDVLQKVLVSNPTGPAGMEVRSFADYSYLHWHDSSQDATPNSGRLGVLGFGAKQSGKNNFIYRANGFDPWNGGAEVFRVSADDSANWLFGIGTDPSAAGQPREKFHVLTSMLISSSAANTVLFASTATNSVSIATRTQSHALTVGGGLLAASSITAQGGFFGDGAGITNLQTGALPGVLDIATITARPGSGLDGVVFSTAVYVQTKMSVGELAEPQQSDFHLRGVMRLDNKSLSGNDVAMLMYPSVNGSAYIRWDEGALSTKGILGTKATERDLVYRALATGFGDGVQVFRIKNSLSSDNASFIFGTADKNFLPNSRLHVLTDMTVSAEGMSPALFVSTANGYVGVSTGVPQAGFHVGSSMLLGPDRASAVVYFSTQTGYAGIGTGYPAARLEVSGGGIFSSSVTVSGSGLSGAQSALQVIGSTFVVRNDGRVGIGAASPQARLDVAGSAQFGSGVGKSTFTAEGYFQPVSMTSGELQAATPSVIGAVVYNSTIANICFSTGTAAAGQWAVAGTKGDCF